MIDVDTFCYKDNRWQDLFTHLKLKGFDVYPPAIHKGNCLKPYVVIKKSTSSKLFGFSTNQDLYDVMLYVPKDEYSILETKVQEIKEAMKELFPLFKPYGQETDAFYDDDVKGYMVSIMYSNYKKIEYM